MTLEPPANRNYRIGQGSPVSRRFQIRQRLPINGNYRISHRRPGGSETPESPGVPGDSGTSGKCRMAGPAISIWPGISIGLKREVEEQQLQGKYIGADI